jgi:hypothetical protein
MGHALVLPLVTLVLASPLAGQSSGTAAPVRQIEASTMGAERVDVDGRLTEAVWSQARFYSDFTQKDPVEGAAATVLTEVAFVYDDEALYIGARMTSRGRSDIWASTSRRDNAGNSERLIVSLDSYHDSHTAYTFGVTATGVRFDYYHPSDNEFNRDYSFDPIWQAQARIDSTGWTAEMRIPFSQLRFNRQDSQVWGLNLNRYIPSRNEDLYWVLVPKNETGWSSRMGELVGISGVKPTRRLELVPYTAANSTVRGNRDPGNPFEDHYNLTARAGGDIKMGLGTSLTLDATINPDFGQVEADPAEVNLSAVETVFNEKRPFFTEGANLLRGNGPFYFYSRRIGAAPRGSASGDFVDRPLATTILGATKITGRLSSGTSIGLLTAVTDREQARVYDLASGRTSMTPIAPRTGFGVLRLQQEFGPAASTIGLSATAVRRDVDPGSPLASIYTRDAYAGGVDWILRFKGGAYELSGAVGASRVSGDSTVMSSIQKNSAHYFQRPDQSYLHFDPALTTLSGYFGSLRFAKNAGRHWLYNVAFGAESPGWELNDAGRLGAADDIDASASLRYRENAPGKTLRSYSLAMFGFTGWDFGWLRQYRGLDFESGVTFLNFMTAQFSVEYYPRDNADNLTRGGPLMTVPQSWNVNGGLQSSFSSNTQWRVFGIYSQDELSGHLWRLSGSIQVKPSTRWQLSIDPGISREKNPLQYVDQLPNGPAATFGTRYIFGVVNRTTISSQVRLNYAFTPDFTLELYAEPFVASGQYSGLGELTRPRTNTLRRYGSDASTIVQGSDGSFTVTDGSDQFTLDPNFNVLSFRSNVVLRWEWRPGSTLYMVWQQNRFGLEDPLSRARVGDLWSTLSAEGDNYFAVKVSYWLPVH